MTDDTTPPTAPLPGLPAPPPPGSRALPPGTYDDTVVLVTGGGSGLGKAMAAEFARLGADLVIVGRSEERLKAAREELVGLGGRVVVAVCDVRDPERVGAAFDLAEREFGVPGVLVNSAAANFPSPPRTCRPTPGARSWTSR